MYKKIIFIALTITTLTGFTACNKVDVVADTSIKSFEKVLNAASDQVSEDTEYGGWSITAPDGSVKFVWSKDFNQTKIYDVLLELDAQPFLNAGLDTDRLPEGMLVGDNIIVGTDLGNDSLTYNGKVTPVKSYEQIVKLYRDSITYHMSLDHYGVDLMNGNMFEWAKDMTKNDKDIVFVLDPQVFVDAGVDPQNIDGWVFAKVETMDEKGKEIEVEKLLKPFDLDGKQ